MMAHDSREDRRLQHLAHAMSAQAKAEEATDTNIRDWWANVAEAWQRLADPPKIGNEDTRARGIRAEGVTARRVTAACELYIAEIER